uniref:(northern house mosquito) hypothetical protein n=1 Tax=Culex pipiens TaxID=7175 RepID=A0A8D8CJ52_CULPI
MVAVDRFVSKTAATEVVQRRISVSAWRGTHRTRLEAAQCQSARTSAPLKLAFVKICSASATSGIRTRRVSSSAVRFARAASTEGVSLLGSVSAWRVTRSSTELRDVVRSAVTAAWSSAASLRKFVTAN